jgi:pimeloyl-ACP methyl ester carboxylesterase
MVLVGGWGARGFTGYLTRALSRTQYKSLAIKPVRHGGEPTPVRLRFPWPMLRLAQAINDQLEPEPQPRVAIAHSMGCIAALIAALTSPEQQFEAIVMVSPAGFMRNDRSKALARRARYKTTMSVRRALADKSLIRPTWTSLWQNLAYTVANPRRAWEEAQCLPDILVEDWVDEVRARGIKVYAVFGEDDALFPPAQCRWLAERLDGFAVITSGQHDLWYRTEELLLIIGSLIQQSILAPEGTDA